MEVYAEDGNSSNILHSGEQKIHTKEKQMEELNVNLEQAANYLIQLFYQTDQKYSCTRTKIGKLLSIVAFVYARENKQLFSEDIYKYNDCGTSFNELKLFLGREIYMKDSYLDDEQPFDGIFDDRIDIPNDYKCIENLDVCLRNRIKEVFKKFASYSPVSLGMCINSIVNYNDIVDETGKLILSKISTLTKSCFDYNSVNMVLLDYIFATKEEINNIGEHNA